VPQDESVNAGILWNLGCCAAFAAGVVTVPTVTDCLLPSLGGTSAAAAACTICFELMPVDLPARYSTAQYGSGMESGQRQSYCQLSGPAAAVVSSANENLLKDLQKVSMCLLGVTAHLPLLLLK
jgi:hypothetical protein